MKSLQTLVLEEITRTTTTNKTEFFQQGKEISGYVVEQMKNGKPSTLTEAQEKPNFCAFIAVGYWDYANDKIYRAYEFTMNGKKAIGSRFFNDREIYKAYTITQAEELRKENPIFAVYHPLKKEMEERAEIIAQKRTQRAENKKTLLEEKKYSYTDKSFRELCDNYRRNYYGSYSHHLTIYNFSYRSLEDHTADEVLSARITFEGKDYYPKAKTRKEVFDFMVDKSGYFKLPYITALKERASNLKRRREQEERERAKEEWTTKDKSQERQICDNKIAELLQEIKDETAKAKPDNRLVDNLADTLKKVVGLLCFNEYNSYKHWESRLAELLEACRFYRSFKGLKAGCRHMYKYNAEINRYEMIELYKNDPFWGADYSHTSNEVKSI